jgi:hypothetical protein
MVGTVGFHPLLSSTNANMMAGLCTYLTYRASTPVASPDEIDLVTPGHYENAEVTQGRQDSRHFVLPLLSFDCDIVACMSDSSCIACASFHRPFCLSHIPAALDRRRGCTSE